METEPQKKKRTMTPEMLEKLAQARQKAMDKKKMLKELHDKEKAIRQAELDARVQRVQDFEQGQAPPPKQEQPVTTPPPPKDVDVDVQPVVEVIKTAPKKKAASKPKVQKVVKRVVQIDSDDSSSESDGEIDFKTLMKLKYKTKYQNKYQVKPVVSAPEHVAEKPVAEPKASRDLPKEAAADVIKAKVDQEIRRVAYANLFGGL